LKNYDRQQEQQARDEQTAKDNEPDEIKLIMESFTQTMERLTASWRRRRCSYGTTAAN
jgi:hypothetical protein